MAPFLKRWPRRWAKRALPKWALKPRRNVFWWVDSFLRVAVALSLSDFPQGEDVRPRMAVVFCPSRVAHRYAILVTNVLLDAGHPWHCGAVLRSLV